MMNKATVISYNDKSNRHEKWQLYYLMVLSVSTFKNKIKIKIRTGAVWKTQIGQQETTSRHSIGLGGQVNSNDLTGTPAEQLCLS